jgi:LysR family transcriptional regulator, transcriptional activator for bauABCD operon
MIGRLSDIDIRLLRIFVAVVEQGSFSVAATRLNVSESTVSTHMADLEKRLGMRLCERGRAGFRLTEDGEEVFRATTELLAEAKRFRDKLATLRSALGGTLKIGLPDAMVTHANPALPKA